MRSRRSTLTARPSCSFVPPYLLRQVALSGSERARLTLDTDAHIRSARTVPSAPRARPDRWEEAALEEGQWAVHDAEGSTRLPGRLVRSPGQAPTGDPAVDEAADGIEAALAMFREGLGRDSYDGSGARAVVSVHYSRDYANAFWDGTQLVFGDGDGEVFDRFTRAVDVLGHELSHAVVEHTAALVYQGQSGALNESVADVFAACLKQRLLGQDAAEGDWLIGEGLFLPGIGARALRDMAHPGTAYDDPRLGRDPQPDHMDHYVHTSDDNGGVHLNSGIPNRAFHLAATAIGGDSLGGAGQIWYAALTSPLLGAESDFATFAAATVAVAGAHAGAVRAAWDAVGLVPGDGGGPVGSGPAESGPVAQGRLRMTRTGGFAGLSEVYEVDLADADAEVAEVRSAWQRVARSGSLAHPPVPSAAQPDRFSYTFQVGAAAPVQVAEQDLDDELQDLATAVRRCPRARTAR